VWLWNSVKIAAATTIATLLITVPAAYALYLLNHRHTPVEIAPEAPGHDLLSGQDLSGTFSLEA
jgi:hypothetical protein